MNDQIDATTIINAHKKHDAWNKKRMEIYDELIELADINDSKLSDSIEHNLEYAMEIILRHGTYGENAHALRKYAQYFSLYELFES
jgi:hypothetical protein